MRATLLGLLAALVAGCTVTRTSARFGSTACDYVVYNRTSYALDVRTMFDTTARTTPVQIGTINPGEGLSERAPCAQGAVWVRGFTLPVAIGMPATYPYVDGWVDLTPGAKASVSLSWP